jgi:fibronectin type 3 domain-containing protein
VRKVRETGGIFREGRGVKITATPVDKTPPRVPEDVRGEKRASAVLITWRENTDKDLAGYNVYRIVNGVKEKLNGNIVKANSYLDQKSPNERYVSYSVTAVDAAGNESDSSRESIVILRE